MRRDPPPVRDLIHGRQSGLYWIDSVIGRSNRSGFLRRCGDRILTEITSRPKSPRSAHECADSNPICFTFIDCSDLPLPRPDKFEVPSRDSDIGVSCARRSHGIKREQHKLLLGRIRPRRLLKRQCLF